MALRSGEVSKMKKLIPAFGAVIVSVALIVVCAFLAENQVVNNLEAAVLISVSAVFVVVSVIFAAKTDYESVVYCCRHCGHWFRPSFSAYLCGVHTIKKRYLKCPKCRKRSMCMQRRNFSD